MHIPALYIFLALFLVYWLGLIVLLIGDEREPSLTLVWLLVLVFLPVLGVLLYILVGRDWRVVAKRKGWTQALHAQRVEGMRAVYERNEAAAERFVREWRGTTADKVKRAISAKQVAQVLPAASLELFVAGADKFASLKKDLREAQRFIHLQYFIWEQDELTAEITAILLERLAAGVEVRIIYDWIGSIKFGKRELKQLAGAGAQVHADLRRHPARQLPQPPQDRRHRRRRGLHRRHEHGSGVHRRRPALRRLARHPCAHHGAGGRRSAEAVRLALVRVQPPPRGPLR